MSKDKKYKLNPSCLSVGMGNTILTDHNKVVSGSNWKPGTAEKLMEQGFLVEVVEKEEVKETKEEKKEPTKKAAKSK